MLVYTLAVSGSNEEAWKQRSADECVMRVVLSNLKGRYSFDDQIHVVVDTGIIGLSITWDSWDYAH